MRIWLLSFPSRNHTFTFYTYILLTYFYLILVMYIYSIYIILTAWMRLIVKPHVFSYSRHTHLTPTLLQLWDFSTHSHPLHTFLTASFFLKKFLSLPSSHLFNLDQLAFKPSQIPSWHPPSLSSGRFLLLFFVICSVSWTLCFLFLDLLLIFMEDIL